MVEMEKNKLIILESPLVFPYYYGLKIMYGVYKASSSSDIKHTLKLSHYLPQTQIKINLSIQKF